MTKSEAAQILGLRETALTKAKVKEAHRRMMIANHPDRGGAPYIASKINEAKVSIVRQECIHSIKLSGNFADLSFFFFYHIKFIQGPS